MEPLKGNPLKGALKGTLKGPLRRSYDLLRSALRSEGYFSFWELCSDSSKVQGLGLRVLEALQRDLVQKRVHRNC